MVVRVLACILLGCVSQLALSRQGGQSWTPPKTTVPKGFVDATSFLSNHNFGDPRGGVYRKVTVRVGNLWGGGGEVVEGRGWVKGNNRVVCWNGLEYTAVTVGDQVDLRADVEKVLPKEKPNAYSSHYANNERWTVRQPYSCTGLALLLLAGEVELAEELLDKMLLEFPRAPLRSLATAYLSNRFDRAVTAHMRGEHAAALADAQALQDHVAQIEREALKELSVSDIRWMRESQPGTDPPRVFHFLEPLDALVADNRRRVEKGEQKFDPEALRGLAQKDRIAKLTHFLDQVSARQMGQPGGGISLDTDPVFLAVVAEGPAVADALLEVMATDPRLTRTVTFGRDFFPMRDLWPVAAVARRAFGEIVQYIGPISARDPANLRKWWAQYRDVSVADRLYATLLDDTLSKQAWASAASELVRPIDARRLPSGWVSLGTASAPIYGESLRKGKAPSVSELMSIRSLQIAGLGDLISSSDLFALSSGIGVGLALYKWDRPAAIPVLQALTRRADRLLSKHDRGNAAEEVLIGVGRMTARRLAGGDQAAWKDYERLLPRFDAAGFAHSAVYVLEPLWRSPDGVVSKRLAREFFLDAQFSWSLAAKKGPTEGLSFVTDAIDSPILLIAAFREAVSLRLQDPTTIGTTEIREGHVFWKTATGGGSRGSVSDKDHVIEGHTEPLRVADLVADSVARLKGAPSFELYWSLERRDEAIRKLSLFVGALDRGARQVISPTRWHDYIWRQDSV